MKILVEQEEYIKNEIERLKKKTAHLQEECVSNLTGKFQEMKTSGGSILAEQQRINILQNILRSSSVVTEFNNEQIDIGTLFTVKFADSEELSEFTMIDSNLEGKFTTSNGYITKNSPLGQAVYLKSSSSSFSYQVEDQDMIVGEIVEIISKENVIKKPKKEKLPVSSIDKDKTRYLCDLNKIGSGFRKYYDKLCRYQRHSKVAQREIERLNSITVSQYQHLLTCYHQLSKETLPYRKDYQSICERLRDVKRNLRRNILPEAPSSIVDFGTMLILEMKKSEKITVQELELVPFCYQALDDYNDHYLSIRNWMGFSSYKSQMGDCFVPDNAHSKSFTIAQFNIHPEKLLLPMSSNLSFYTKEEKEVSFGRYQYQKENHSIMTLSQKMLLDKEISKVSETPKMTPYIERLYFLKQSVEEKAILVQTDDMVLENNEEIGLGSFVHYDLLIDGELKSQSGEMISCAFTVEENDQYIEEFSPLGKSLIGKRQDDCFEFLVDGVVQKGVVTSVSNQVVIKDQCYQK